MTGDNDNTDEEEEEQLGAALLNGILQGAKPKTATAKVERSDE